VLVIFDSEDLFKENEAIENCGFKASSDGDDAGHAFGMTSGEGQGEEAADGGADGRMKLADAEVIEQGDLHINEIGGI